jgi:hypothetical protein
MLLLPCLSWSFGFLNISNVELSRLDASNYRLRVTYDWGGDILPWPTLSESPEIYGPANPSLTAFEVKGGGASYNYFASTAAQVYKLAGPSSHVTSTGNIYGFDFAASDPSLSNYSFSTYGEIHWFTSHQIDPNILDPVDQFTESFSGSFDLSKDPVVVPEPTTLLLFGVGAIGTVLARRRLR